MTPNPSAPEHELRDTDVKSVFYWVMSLFIILFGSIAVGVVIHTVLLRWSPLSHSTRPVSPLADFHRVPPEPRLQTNPTIDMVQFRASEDAVLNSYGWLDPKGGSVRLPIARAIQLISERGLPARKANEQP